MRQRLLNWFKFDPMFVLNAVILFVVLNQAYRLLFIRLKENQYIEPVFIHELFNRIPWFFLVVLVLLIANYLPTDWNILRHKWSWKSIDESGRLRLLVMVVVILMGWAYSAYGYNHYYDQPHYIERILLILLVIGCWFSPLLVGPMVVVTYAISAQLTYPPELAYSYTDKFVIFQFLLVFAFFVYIRPFTRAHYSVFIFVVLCLVGAFYYYPGYQKLAISTNETSWIFDNDVHTLFLSSYLNGWLSFLPHETALQITDILGSLKVPFQIFTVVIELAGVLLVLFRRRIAMFILAGAILLHVGIFVSSGVFFWKWIVLDGTLIWYLWATRKDTRINDIFRPVYGVLSVFVIVYANFFGAILLGWWDGPYNNYFDYEVVDTQGNTYEFSRSFLQPYDLRTTQSRMYFLIDQQMIADTYGTIHSIGAYEALREGGIDVIGQVRNQYGEKSFHPSYVNNFVKFVERYFTSYNQQRGKLFLPSIIRPPLHIWTIPRPTAYDNQHPIETVRIRYTETFYDGEEVIILRDDVVLEIDILQE